MSSFNWPPRGGTQIAEYANLAAFPSAVTAGNGAFALALDTDILYVSNGTSWLAIAGPGSVLSLGNLDAQAGTAQGAALVASSLSMQSATTLVPGLINNTTQSFSGNKTFTGTIGASNLSGTNTGDVTIGTANGLSLVAQALSLGLSSTSTTGALSSTDWNIFNGKQATVSFAPVGAVPSANGGGISAGVITLQPADGTHPGLVTELSQTIGGSKSFLRGVSVGGLIDETQLHIQMSAGQTAIPFEIWQGFSSMFNISAAGAVQAQSNIAAGGGSYMSAGLFKGQTAAMATTGVYNLGNGEAVAFRNILNNGDKTLLLDSTNKFQFDAAVNSSGNMTAANLSGTNSGDVTIGTANGLSLVAQALSLGLSSTSTTGALSSTDWNIFNGKQAAGSYITALTGDVTASGPGSVSATIGNNVVTNAKAAQMAANTIKGNNTGSTANASDLSVSDTLTMLKAAFTAPTIQRFTSGNSQTYTTPANVLYLLIRMSGGGGGGGSSGTSGGGNVNGSDGNLTRWKVSGGSDIVLAGGGGHGFGGGNSANGGVGGTNTFSSPSVKIRDITGGAGSTDGPDNGTVNGTGGAGGANPLGGAGASTYAGANGGAGATNTGAGGAGAASGGSAYTGIGGGAGGYVEFILTSPSATYGYTVGTGGAGGVTNSSGFTGGAGADGVIEVIEYYQ